MTFGTKKTTEQLQWEIYNKAQAAANNSLSNLGYGGAADSVKGAIAMAIAQAVMEGFKVMMANQYTDEDFEKDVGLKG